MTKINIEIGEQANYDGSKVFSSLADMVGLSVDLTNFLIIQGLALLLASFFRSYLHPSKVSASVRHSFGLVIGLFFGYFCFGQQAIHIAGLPAVCYIVIRTQNPQIVQRTVLFVALTYLSCIHLHRQYKDYGSYTLDITGPLMIITQKVVSLAFSIHDGFVKETKELTKTQQYHAIYKVPSPLEYFAFALNFQSLMAGPLILYRDYIEFVEGCNLKTSNSNGSIDESRKKIMQEPSPVKAIVKKILSAIICAYIFLKLINVYPIKNVKDDEFMYSSSFAYKLWYLMMTTTAVRFKYYFAWLLADAIVNNAGLGFNGYETDGAPKWDLFTNIYVIPFELGTSFRDSINNWNIGTNLWLRMVVYERVPKNYGTMLTFALSALWHGFYPGYYITFATGALVVMAARKSRRLFRHHFQQSELSRTFYDILTCIVTRIFMAYTTFPFVLLEFGGSFRVYLKLFMCLHVIALLAVFVVPKLIRTNSTDKLSSSTIIKTKKSDDIPSTCDPKNGKMTRDNADAKMIVAINGIADNTAADVDDSSNFSSCSTSSSNSLNDISKSCDKNPRKTDTNYLLKDLINKEVNKRSDNLHNLLKEKIVISNIEEFFDKTVNGIVELKDDLMTMNQPEVYGGVLAEGLRKRNLSTSELEYPGSVIKTSSDGVFLKKEIDAIKGAGLPAVLSNGHAK